MTKRKVVRVLSCFNCPCSVELQYHRYFCQLAERLDVPEPTTSDFHVPSNCPLRTIPVVLKPKE